MDNHEVIVILTKHNLELQQALEDLTTERNDITEDRDNLKGHINDIQAVLDYCGHPGNTVGVLKSVLKALR